LTRRAFFKRIVFIETQVFVGVKVSDRNVIQKAGAAFQKARLPIFDNSCFVTISANKLHILQQTGILTDIFSMSRFAKYANQTDVIHLKKAS
ncbi:MAG: hypothetical protein AABZ60_20585, partial [Planctomycetota bacterium]